ncbi:MULTISPECIES: DUF177 domain-containing protein [unclassified Novosphingobium]|uniref:YceD family protein n=1 Tax=unclassified Novosphingobium TaxID=2644732 RepID=UPI0014948F70|nr:MULTISPECIES: DUF177 domain-containing protein [unclassified Novosphingobium]MBB3360204.1 uncharacterized metal-binding protein YceD (DUF177 family) [Novosphingobium sp. BK256]MBB3376533.1 uncharacterized metal-binding protein YceD (DUF177 family) [Novosphingobium sp. BK280]MBB3380946.1 uncharacterized metal-binding protein YceD (DUF177 family) [Novosphingobium sp. BK258]MBB3422597.1 uncharacterized metal-binding protein YceD (DUF177 family) [Novosphingobium sp. BK267]MBB3451250.1 uncharact
MSDTPEYSYIVDLRQIGDAPLVLEPDADARRRLAGRFGITAIDAARAQVKLIADGPVVRADGRLTAAIIQACAISGEDFPVKIDEPLHLRFVPETQIAAEPDEEIELSADDCDEIPYTGLTFDLGEAVAQSLALAIDPFAEGPLADKARAEHNLAGDEASGPFAALAALRGKE